MNTIPIHMFDLTVARITWQYSTSSHVFVHRLITVVTALQVSGTLSLQQYFI